MYGRNQTNMKNQWKSGQKAVPHLELISSHNQSVIIHRFYAFPAPFPPYLPQGNSQEAILNYIPIFDSRCRPWGKIDIRPLLPRPFVIIMANDHYKSVIFPSGKRRAKVDFNLEPHLRDHRQPTLSTIHQAIQFGRSPEDQIRRRHCVMNISICWLLRRNFPPSLLGADRSLERVPVYFRLSGHILGTRFGCFFFPRPLPQLILCQYQEEC